MVECFIFNRNGDFLFNFALNSHCLFQSLPLPPPPPPPQKKERQQILLKIFLLYENGKCNKKRKPRYGLFPEKFARSSHFQTFFKIAVLKNFAIFTGKHLCWCLFVIKRHRHRCFPVNIVKFLGTRILKNMCERLLLGFLRTFFNLHFKESDM